MHYLYLSFHASDPQMWFIVLKHSGSEHGGNDIDAVEILMQSKFLIQRVPVVNPASVNQNSVLGVRNFGFPICRNSFSKGWIPTLKLNIDLYGKHTYMGKHYFTRREFLLNFMISARHNSGWVVDNWQLMKQECQHGLWAFRRLHIIPGGLCDSSASSSGNNTRGP